MDTQIRYFLKIAELSSLSRAADELDLTHSYLSHQLATLEAFVGQSLFVRTGRGVKLTDAGQKLRKETSGCYERIDAVVESIKDKEGISEINLRIAAIHTLSYYFVANLLAKFISQRGHVNLSVMARSSPDVVNLVEKGKADIGFVYGSAVASGLLESVPLFQDRMCLIVQQEGSERASAEDLAATHTPLVGFPAQFALRKMLKGAGLDACVVAEANTVEAMLHLVSSGIGSCILPERIPSQLLAEYHLTKVNLAAPGLSRGVVAIVRGSATAPSLARQLLKMATNAVTD